MPSSLILSNGTAAVTIVVVKIGIHAARSSCD